MQFNNTSCSTTTAFIFVKVAAFRFTPLDPFSFIWGPFLESPDNFSGAFRVTQFSLYLQNEGVSRHETLQLLSFLLPLQHIKRPALQNKQVVVLRLAFRARKVVGTFEKRAPDDLLRWNLKLISTYFIQSCKPEPSSCVSIFT